MMTNYEKEFNRFYLKVVDTIEHGVNEHKYFYNTFVFDEGSGYLTDYMERKIFEIISQMFPDDKSVSYLNYYNDSKYSTVSFISCAKEIGRYATMSYYKDKFIEDGKIDLDMNVRNFNISSKAFNLLESMFSDTDDISLKHVLKLTKSQVLNYSNSNRFNKKDVLDLIDFCDSLISDFTSVNGSEYAKLYDLELLLRSKEVLDKISVLEKKYDEIYNKRKELELTEQKTLVDIQKLREELFEINSVRDELGSKRSI